MKKIFLTVCLALGVSVMTFAQNEEPVDETFVFTMGDGGEVVANGSTLTGKIEEDPVAGTVQVESGLFVKNASSNLAYLKVEYIIKSYPTGSYFKYCFPELCLTNKEIGVTYETPMGTFQEGQVKSFADEWFPQGVEGTCTVTYRIKVYGYVGMQGPNPIYDFIGYGPTVTVNYIYTPTGIKGTISDKENIVSSTYYDISGRKINEPGKGLYIQKAKLSDGSVKSTKVLVK